MDARFGFWNWQWMGSESSFPFDIHTHSLSFSLIIPIPIPFFLQRMCKWPQGRQGAFHKCSLFRFIVVFRFSSGSSRCFERERICWFFGKRRERKDIPQPRGLRDLFSAWKTFEGLMMLFLPFCFLDDERESRRRWAESEGMAQNL